MHSANPRRVLPLTPSAMVYPWGFTSQCSFLDPHMQDIGPLPANAFWPSDDSWKVGGCLAVGIGETSGVCRSIPIRQTGPRPRDAKDLPSLPPPSTGVFFARSARSAPTGSPSVSPGDVLGEIYRTPGPRAATQQRRSPCRASLGGLAPRRETPKGPLRTHS